MPSDAAKKSPFTAEFAIRIRLLRARFQLSRQELVSAIGGICDEQIWKMENGNAIYLSLEALGGLIAFALERGVSLSWLFTGLGPMELPAADPNGTTTRAHQDGRLTVNPQSAIRDPQCGDGTTTRAHQACPERSRRDGRLTGGDSDRV